MISEKELAHKAIYIWENHILPNKPEGAEIECADLCAQYAADPKRCCAGKLKRRFISAAKEKLNILYNSIQ